jgi:UDP-N-acetylmuramoyl-tripeptide--D-alanyl-D-alanine ligase
VDLRRDRGGDRRPASASFEVTGVTFDSREVQPGDLFVAMPARSHDGHTFVDAAFAAGAAAAIVAQPIDRPHVLVDDVFAALQALGRAARERSQATIFGVTGSVGKTSTKEALYAALERIAPGRAHRSVKSYNNHTGVPLSLARMPRDAAFAVFEMGMNNAGEIAALTAQVRPHLALITAIAPAHIENLGSEEAIADAKGEIFQGLEPDGIAIVPERHAAPRPAGTARAPHAENHLTFGAATPTFMRCTRSLADGGSLITAALLEAK